MSRTVPQVPSDPRAAVAQVEHLADDMKARARFLRTTTLIWLAVALAFPFVVVAAKWPPTLAAVSLPMLLVAVVLGLAMEMYALRANDAQRYGFILRSLVDDAR